MSLPRKDRDEISAAMTQTLCLMVVCCGLLGLTVELAAAANPSWWSNGAVAPEYVTNSGVVTQLYIPSPKAVATVGQLKQFTARAVDELNGDLAVGAGTTLNSMVSNWAWAYAQSNYSLANPDPHANAAVTVGQLKYVGNLLWAQLVAGGYTNAVPSWLATNSTDGAAAVVGQVEAVFNFDLNAPSPVTNLAATANGSGEIDLSWTLPSQNYATYLSIMESADGGSTWTSIATINPTSTAFAATDLDPGTSYLFAVVSATGAGSTMSSATAPQNPPPYPPAEPLNLTGSYNSSNNMMLTWTASTGATSYVIDREYVPTGAWTTDIVTLAASGGPAMSYTDTFVSNGGYHYRVSAQGSGGTSMPSNIFPISRYAIVDLGLSEGSVALNNSNTVVSIDPFGLFEWQNGTKTYLSVPNGLLLNSYGVVLSGPVLDDQNEVAIDTIDDNGYLAIWFNGSILEGPSAPSGASDQGLGGQFASVNCVSNGTVYGSAQFYQAAQYLWTEEGQVENLTYYFANVDGAKWSGGGQATELGSVQNFQYTTYDGNSIPIAIATNNILEETVQAVNGHTLSGDGNPWIPPGSLPTNNYYEFFGEGNLRLDGAVITAPNGPFTGGISGGYWSLTGNYVTINSYGEAAGTGTNGINILYQPEFNQSTNVTALPAMQNLWPTAMNSNSVAVVSGGTANVISSPQIICTGAATALAERSATTGSYGYLFLDDLTPEGSLLSMNVPMTWQTSINNNGVIAGRAWELDSNGNPIWSDDPFYSPVLDTAVLIPDQILRDHMPITNNLVCVGQQIVLTNSISGIPASAITSYQWTIPGAIGDTNNDTAIYDYEPTAQNSNYTNLITPTNYTTNAACSFYWTAAGTNQVVTCQAVIYGQTNTMSASFNVVRPTATESATHGLIAADTNFNQSVATGLPYLHFGAAIGSNVGMNFTQVTTQPSGFSGTNSWVQLLTNTSATFITPLSGQTKTTWGYDGGRQNYYPYPFHSADESSANDSPGAPLASDDISVSRNFNAKMYLMWQAFTNSTGGDKTIPVPLKSYQWNWSGTATNNSGAGWVLVPTSTNYPNSTATNIDVTNEPTWSTNAAYNYH